MAIFISHSRQNSGAAFKLSEALERRQVKTWLDLRELDSGTEWKEQIAAAIHHADGFVFLIGPPGSDDQFQKFDWQRVVEEEYYLDSNRVLIPVVIGGADLPGFLGPRKAISVDAASIDFEAIASDIRDWIGKPGDTVDEEKVERGRKAREQALKNLREHSRELEEEEVKRAGLRGLK